MTPNEIRAGSVPIGTDHLPFIAAEMSGNHNGDLGRALEIVDMVAESGAQAIKLQTYTADTLTIDADQSAFRISEGHPLWGGATLYELYSEASTPWDWHSKIFERAQERGLIAFSSPFDVTAVELLEDLGAPLYKIASLEIGDLELLRLVAQTGKPVILSNGAATLSDLELAVQTIRSEGNDKIIVLGCTSSYPASPAESNLRSLPVIQGALGVQVGLSDHTMGIGAAVAAVAFGATVIEKHVTMSREHGGVDSDFSLEPGELKSLVEESKTAWLALGEPTLRPTEGEAESLRLRRSLYVVNDVRAGEEVSRENVRSIRPAGGMEPRFLPLVLGRTFNQDIRRGTPLAWDFL